MTFTSYAEKIERKDIDLDNPIFVYYIDSRGHSRQSIRDHCDQVLNSFPRNITVWVVPSEQPSKIELVYDGRLQIKKLKELSKTINDMHSDLESSETLGEFKSKIRDYLLNALLDE